MTRGWAAPLAYGAAIALVVAALLHLGLILLLPLHASQDAWSRLGGTDPGARDATVTDPAILGRLARRDPAMAAAACRYDLRGGPVWASLEVARVPFAVLSVHSRTGRVLYGLTDRSATGTRITLLILTPAQAAERPPRTIGALPDIQVVTTEPEGFAFAQVLATAPSQAPQAAAAAATLTCRRAAT